LPTRVAENRKARFERHPCAADRSIVLRAVRAPKITPPDISRARSDRVIFVRPARFAPVFVTRDAARHVRAVGGSIAHTPDETTSCAFCRRRLDQRGRRL